MGGAPAIIIAGILLTMTALAGCTGNTQADMVIPWFKNFTEQPVEVSIWKFDQDLIECRQVAGGCTVNAQEVVFSSVRLASDVEHRILGRVWDSSTGGQVANQAWLVAPNENLSFGFFAEDGLVCRTGANFETLCPSDPNL